MILIADIDAARERIALHVRRTPVLRPLGAKEPLPAADVVLKLECLQVTGSFKARGAMNRLLGTPAAALANGIVTASGGNHGLAVARAAFAAGTAATIYLPVNVSPAKLAKMKRWGARTEIVGASWDDANAAALAFVEETGAVYFHPFADPLAVAGQGTLGLEILDDLPDIDTILVAIGGGGLVAGLATAVKSRRPNIRIIGIEPAGSPTLRASLDAGRVVTLPAVTTKVPTMACRRTSASSRLCATRSMTSSSSRTKRWRTRRAGCGSRPASRRIYPAPLRAPGSGAATRRSREAPRSALSSAARDWRESSNPSQRQSPGRSRRGRPECSRAAAACRDGSGKAPRCWRWRGRASLESARRYR